MQTITTFTTALILICFCFSCDNAEKRAAALNEIEVLQAKIGELNETNTTYSQNVTKYQSELEVANDRLARVKEFEFGRTTDEREEQIRKAKEYITELEKAITEHQTAIQEIKQNIEISNMKIEQLKAVIKE